MNWPGTTLLMLLATLSGLADGAVAPPPGLWVSLNFCIKPGSVTPIMVSAVTGDSNGDGQLDHLTLTFSVPVDIIDPGGASDGFDAITLDGGYVIANRDYSATDVTTLVLDLVPLGPLDTGALVTPTYHTGQPSYIANHANLGRILPDGETEPGSDGAAPVLIGLALAPPAMVNDAPMSYTLSEPLASGTATWTWVGGVPDPAPHVQALTGVELAVGAHTNVNFGSPTLVDGAIYDFALNGQDAAGNPAVAAVLTNVPVTTGPALTITTNDLRAYEGWPITLTVTASTAPLRTATVGLTYGGTAVPSVDFNGPSQVTFGPGTTTQTITVNTLRDNLTGPTQTITIQLTGVTGATIGSPDLVSLELRDTDGDGEALGAFLAGKPAGSYTAQLGETLQLVIHDGMGPYRIATDNGGYVAGTPLNGATDLDGDGDPDLGERVTVVASQIGTQRITVIDATGARVDLNGVINSGTAMYFQPPAVTLSSGTVTAFNAIGAGDGAGVSTLATTAAQSNPTQLLASLFDAPTQTWFDLPQQPTSGLVPFNGFFVATRNPLPWSGLAVPAPISYAIPLLPGDNFFSIPPLIDGIRVATSFPFSDFEVLDEFGVSLPTAVRNRLLGDHVLTWNGSAWVPATVLESGRAYFLDNTSSGPPQTLTLRLNVLTNGYVPAGTGGSTPPIVVQSSGRKPGSCGMGTGIAGIGLMLLFALWWRGNRR
jgi:hypothetical protein